MSTTPNSELTKELEKHIGLRAIVTPFFRHRRLFIITLLALFSVTLVATMFNKKVYESRLEILVNRARVDPLVTEGATSQFSTQPTAVTEEEINSEAELIRSQDTLVKVVEATGLADTKPSRWSFRDRQQYHAARVDSAVARLAQDLKIKLVPKSNMFEVTYQSTDPHLSYKVLDTLGELYLEKNVQVHRRPGSLKLFTDVTRRYKAELDDAEKRLRSFGETNQLAAPDLQRTALADQVAKAIGQIHTTEQSVAADRARVISDEQQLRSSSPRTSAARTTSAPTMLLQQLGAALLTVQTKRIQLAAKYSPDYPLVREADAEVAEAKAAFDRAQTTEYVSSTTDNDPTYQAIAEDLARTRSDLAGQTASLSALESGVTSMRDQLVKLNTASLQQHDLQREAKTDEDKYLLYQGKQEEVLASDALDRSHITNVLIAVPPAIPAVPLPQAVPPVLLALGVAFFASIMIVYLTAFLDPAIYTPLEVSELTNVPVIITMPRKAA